MTPLTAPPTDPPPALVGLPLDPARRLVAVDAVRGFALLGILLVNAAYFAMPMAWVDEPLYYGPHSGLDLAVWSGVEVFATGKFITLFSMLFGAGVWLMAARADAAGRATAGTHYKRMAWLLAIGLVHAYLIWSGDVLASYAVAGMILYPMRRLTVRVQLALAAVFLVVGSLLAAAWGGVFWVWEALDPQGYAAFEPFPEEDIDAEVAAYRGGFFTQAAWRVPEAMSLQVLLGVLFGPWYLAMMLIGVVLARTGVLGGGWSRAFYGRVLVVGLAVGWPLTALAQFIQWSAAELDFATSMFLVQVHYWVAPLVGFAYAAGLIRLVQAGALPAVTAALAAVGRMALTNYLMQSLIFTLVFYGHGLGRFGTMGFAGVIPLVAATWLLQIGLSRVWLGRFRFGPMEWLWRSLTYGAPQPLRKGRAAAEHAAGA